MFFKLPNYSFSIYSCHCKLHCESLSQFFFLLVAIKNSPQGPLLCVTCTLPRLLWSHSCLCFSPNLASCNLQKHQLHSSPYPGDRCDISTIAVGRAGPAKQTQILRLSQEKFDSQRPFALLRTGAPASRAQLWTWWPWPLLYLQAALIGWHPGRSVASPSLPSY